MTMPMWTCRDLKSGLEKSITAETAEVAATEFVVDSGFVAHLHGRDWCSWEIDVASVPPTKASLRVEVIKVITVEFKAKAIADIIRRAP